MSSQNGLTYCLSKLSLSPKATALESTLQQCLINFKDFLLEYQQLYIEMENYKTELSALKEKCGSQCCSSSEALKKDNETKNSKMQLAASVLSKLEETKNFSFLTEAFNILCGGSKVTIPDNSQELFMNNNKEFKVEKETIPEISPNVKKKTPKKDLSMSIDDGSFKDESVSEIDGTPTGQLSPIILSRNSRKLRCTGNLSRNSELKDTMKRSGNWPTPEAKAQKVLITTSNRSRPGSGKLIQKRLQFNATKPLNFVDLTSSPEFSGGSRGNSESATDVQKLIKKESSENDDTILPSPTSGPANFILSKSTCKENQAKFKKPLSLSRVKYEETNDPILQNVKTEPDKAVEMEHSINILNPNRCTSCGAMRDTIPGASRHHQEKHGVRYLNCYACGVDFRRLAITTKASPMKEPLKPDEDVTHCETQAPANSVSLLQHMDKLASDDVPNSVILNYCSPAKRPLAENINIANVAAQDGDSSMSMLSREVKQINKLDAIDDNAIRKEAEKVLPVYKEATVRKKAEKRTLPAWCCDECEAFFGTLYGNDPEKRAKQIANCSKHRGRNNPVRPKTPPGFWYPRWDVPSGTEEFNRRNNVD